jgi:hypothetical protein
MKYRASKEIVSKIAGFLLSGPILDRFEFPRLHFPNLPGYKPKYYREMGELIKAGTVPVSIDENAPKDALAYYEVEGGGHFYLTKQVAKLNTPKDWSAVVHETTHMIQDWKKWRITMSEVEADAHFAQALFMHFKGASLDSGGLLGVYDAAAKAFASGDKKEFKKLIGRMYLSVNEKYQDKPGYEDMHKKERQDGI